MPFDDGLAAAALEVALLPILARCARSCPERVEGTACAVLMAAYHLGLFCSAHLSSALTGRVLGIARGQLSLLWVARVVTSLLQLLPLLLLGLLPGSGEEGEAARCPRSLRQEAEARNPR
uniref:Uncharacterized protein n=1 Tax=Alexandrium monilatum TaxID=311494 RepID=A0A7S4UY87_9DINO